MKKAIILLSGGLDSATITAIAKQQGFEIYCLSFEYGQRHNIELDLAKKIAKNSGAKEHRIAKIDLRMFGHSALTSEIAVPKNSDFSTDEIPVTYVPARNTIFLSYALAYGEVVGASDIFIGVNAVDYSGYPDCRKEFIDAYEKMANLATAISVSDGGQLKIHTPLINLSKKEIIAEGLKLGVDYSNTHSCYDPIIKDEEIFACGKCDSCLLRLKGFSELEQKDPINYIS